MKKYPTRLTTKQPHRSNIIKPPIQLYHVPDMETGGVSRNSMPNFSSLLLPLSLTPPFVCTLEYIF